MTNGRATEAVEGAAPFSLAARNPDVLTCIANLSNDEVFTPPEFANQMLDALAVAWAASNDGADLWSNESVTFLDPFTKSGVFPREITKRLVQGLADEIPDLNDRVNHILTKQVFGIAITELTALLARRTVYCSKWAVRTEEHPHSIASSFGRDWGNIWFERTEHTWAGGRCKHCNAAEGEYGRSEDLETHAYAFIHTASIRQAMQAVFGGEVQFDVIIGNPPYQLGADGGNRDIPIYHLFVEQAKKLEPRFLSMVIPARWMAGGLGLGTFREAMLTDKRLSALVDYPSSKDVFPSVDVKGGICHFLWEANHSGSCSVTTVRGDVSVGPVLRQLDEFDVFVRDARALGILHKVLSCEEESIVSILSADKEFGWTSNFRGFHLAEQEDDVPIYYNESGRRLIGYIDRREVLKSGHLVDTWKVMVPKAGSGANAVPDAVLGKPWIAPSPSVCTQTFLFFFVESEAEAKSIGTYLRTRFLRFLVSLRKITQDATRSTYSWVPQQTWDREWTDADLYAKYGLSEDEVAFIEAMIRPMESDEASGSSE